jgi:hypothetical protein
MILKLDIHSLRQRKLYINVFKDDHHFEKKKDILMLHSIIIIFFVSITPISIENSSSKNPLVKSFKETKYSWSQNFMKFSKFLCII